jgi:hypothetical protein
LTWDSPRESNVADWSKAQKMSIPFEPEIPLLRPYPKRKNSKERKHYIHKMGHYTLVENNVIESANRKIPKVIMAKVTRETSVQS